MLDVKWIFFDVGSTLVDETLAYDHRAKDMLEGTGISFADFDSKRREFARLGLDGNSEAIRYFGLRKTPWHWEDERPYADAEETLKALRARGFRLGIIANQIPGTEERLKTWGLREYFDVVAASAELGVAKPDKRIFARALEMAGCLPRDAAMVGDRLDNDILPAKAVGMKTVWIRRMPKGGQSSEPGTPQADWVVEELRELKKLFLGTP